MAGTVSATHRDTIKSIIEAMEKASGGDPDAAKRLRDASDDAAAESKPAAPAAPPVKGLTVKDKIIIRPNGQEYHVRQLEEHDDVAMLRKCRVAGIFPLLTGPPGTGKTAVIEAAFAGSDLPEKQRKVYTVQGHGDTTVGDFVGGFIQLPSGLYDWIDGPLIRAAEEGVELYIDEIVLIDPKVLAIVYSLMDGRKEIMVTDNPERGIVHVKDGFHISAAANPNAPGARMSEALTSRFTLQYQVTTDFGLAKKLGVDAKAVKVARNMNTKLSEGECSWAPQLRELLAFRDMQKLFGDTIAYRNLVSQAPEIDRPIMQDVVSRAVGEQYLELKTS